MTILNSVALQTLLSQGRIEINSNNQKFVFASSGSTKHLEAAAQTKPTFYISENQPTVAGQLPSSSIFLELELDQTQTAKFEIVAAANAHAQLMISDDQASSVGLMNPAEGQGGTGYQLNGRSGNFIELGQQSDWDFTPPDAESGFSYVLRHPTFSDVGSGDSLITAADIRTFHGIGTDASTDNNYKKVITKMDDIDLATGAIKKMAQPSKTNTTHWEHQDSDGNPTGTELPIKVANGANGQNKTIYANLNYQAKHIDKFIKDGNISKTTQYSFRSLDADKDRDIQNLTRYIDGQPNNKERFLEFLETLGSSGNCPGDCGEYPGNPNDGRPGYDYVGGDDSVTNAIFNKLKKLQGSTITEVDNGNSGGKTFYDQNNIVMLAATSGISAGIVTPAAFPNMSERSRTKFGELIQRSSISTNQFAALRPGSGNVSNHSTKILFLINDLNISSAATTFKLDRVAESSGSQKLPVEGLDPYVMVSYDASSRRWAFGDRNPDTSGNTTLFTNSAIILDFSNNGGFQLAPVTIGGESTGAQSSSSDAGPSALFTDQGSYMIDQNLNNNTYAIVQPDPEEGIAHIPGNRPLRKMLVLIFKILINTQKRSNLVNLPKKQWL